MNPHTTRTPQPSVQRPLVTIPPVLLAVCCSFLLLSAASAQASITLNGISVNGITTNGLFTNGITANGATINGAAMQGLTLKGLLQALGALRVTKLDSEQPPPAHCLPWHQISHTALGQH